MYLGEMIKIGKVTGYVIKIEINPIDTSVVSFEADDPTYTIRIFGECWDNGYFDIEVLKSNMWRLESLLS